MLGFWSFPSFARESWAVALFSSHISFACLIPIRGAVRFSRATSLRTDDLFYPATARGGLVFTQPCLLQELQVTADPLTLSLRFAAMGVTVSRLTLIVKRANDIFCEHANKNS